MNDGKLSSERQGISRLRKTVGCGKSIGDDLDSCNELGATTATVPSYDMTVGAMMYIIVLFNKITVCQKGKKHTTAGIR